MSSKWKLSETGGSDSQSVTLEVQIPGNSTATVEIPATSEKVRVRESDRLIWNNGNEPKHDHSGVEGVHREDDTVLAEVGSGSYSFRLEPLGQ